MHPPIIQLRTSIYSNPAERMPETLHTAHISALRACTSTITLIITLSYSGRLLWICIGPVNCLFVHRGEDPCSCRTRFHR